MTSKEITDFNHKCAKFLGWELFKAKSATHNIYGCFEEWDEEDDVYVDQPTNEFRQHLILSNPEQVGLSYDFDLFKSYYYASNLKFHYDWGWIMQIIDRIETLKFTSETCTNASPAFTICKFSCFLSISNDKDVKTMLPKNNKYYYQSWKSGQMDNRLHATITVINEFLDWYETSN